MSKSVIRGHRWDSVQENELLSYKTGDAGMWSGQIKGAVHIARRLIVYSF
jgi:hypothetical protein